jgi:hypothetical protein
MGKKIFLGGLAGGIVVFAMLSFWHVATSVGETGVHSLPAEDSLGAAMGSAIHYPGMYFFPGMTMTPGLTKEQQRAVQSQWNEKFLKGPTGILIYHPGGVEFSFGKALTIQFVICLLSALLIAGMLGMAAGGFGGYGSRVLFVTLASLFAGIFMELPLWNWYGFPTDFTIAQIGISVASWLVAGLVMAKIVK